MRDIHVALVKTSGEVEDKTISNQGSLEYLQGWVDGYIEVVSHPEFDMIINEEGRINKLPINMTATMLLRGLREINMVTSTMEWGRMKMSKPPVDTMQALETYENGQTIIHGDVVICGPVDQHGYETSIKEAVRRSIPRLWTEPHFEVTVF
ncbi:MAG: hypothetical protein GOVbin2833_19 [Prokaryotic dsDNA virus sp.]|nr:MAG: hypothetical protein GOVbin2833_19 [Prokaryotic dsDNA virus sp.]|tara:strand:+ start:14424 stop:14876 length:453 start_codon:yes stop_codon:yes gene_type:complete